MTARPRYFEPSKDVGLVYRFLFTNLRRLLPAAIIVSGVYLLVEMIFPAPFPQMDVRTPDPVEWREFLLPFVGVYLGFLPLLTASLSLVVFDMLKNDRYRPRAYLDRIWERLLPLVGVVAASSLIVSLPAIFAFSLPPQIASLLLLFAALLLSLGPFLFMFAPLMVLVEGRGVLESLKGSVMLAKKAFVGLVIFSIFLFLAFFALSIPIIMVPLLPWLSFLAPVAALVLHIAQISLSAALHAFAYVRLSADRPF